MDAIEPKPTKYKRRTFKSRLEARWAVFFDHQLLTWVYEPKTFKNPETGWDYTPDFVICFSRLGCKAPFKVFVEVKPIIPTDEYLHVLSKFTSILGADLWLCWGSFFKTVPKVCNLSTTPLMAKDITKTSTALNQCKAFTRPDKAIVTAAMYRFDLPQKKSRKK